MSQENEPLPPELQELVGIFPEEELRARMRKADAAAKAARAAMESTAAGAAGAADDEAELPTARLLREPSPNPCDVEGGGGAGGCHECCRVAARRVAEEVEGGFRRHCAERRCQRQWFEPLEHKQPDLVFDGKPRGSLPWSRYL
ncbi:unnamed protein product [Effrenium voratum]|uniref:Uncharacterized protein n=1 Tax=Effrenium voratum TaxID=2562239 RepID=A0AA36NHH3_9DINO|nr:unnamed protein product [Effrenium voratum]